MSKTQSLFGGVLILLSFSLLFVLPLLPLNSNKTVILPIEFVNKPTYLLVFFGYPHCNEICPQTLQSLNQVYRQQTRYQAKTLQVVLINLDTTDSSATISAYARSFHPDFKGVQLSKTDLSHVKQDFGAMAIKVSGETAQILHSPTVYFLEHQQHNSWKIKTIYRDAAQFERNFLEDTD